MQIAVIYETGEGQTRKIVQAVTDQIRALGHGVNVIDTAEKTATIALDQADRVILAAPVHERRHPRMFEATLTALREGLSQRPVLMVSVSLKAAFPDGLEEAEEYLTDMQMRTGVTPTHSVLVAGAVRPGSYDYFQSQIVRHVALAGHPVKMDGDIKEFTDWNALSDTVASFLES